MAAGTRDYGYNFPLFVGILSSLLVFSSLFPLFFLSFKLKDA